MISYTATRQSRRLPIRAESACRVRVRVASDDDFRRFPLVWRPIGRGRGPPQKVLWPFGLPLLNRNAFRRGHSLGIVLHRKQKLTRINTLLLDISIYDGTKHTLPPPNIHLVLEKFIDDFKDSMINLFFGI